MFKSRGDVVSQLLASWGIVLFDSDALGLCPFGVGAYR